MNIEERLLAFEKLGNYINAIDEVEFKQLADQTRQQNPWFTDQSIKIAFEGLKTYLSEPHLRKWVSSYDLPSDDQKTIAVVMAGNIPLVGFHDFLSVLISGHSIMIKLSSKDSVLLTFFAEKLLTIEPRFKTLIAFAERLKNFDAVIATGSDNSARYFHYYFGKYPNIIRKNRTSVAVLTGKESAEELRALGNDIFLYFGLGCRNVSKIFIPENFNPSLLFENWKSFEHVIHHYKYRNNYDYQKSILLINKTRFLDAGFVMLQESELLVSPISVIYYETYKDEGDLALKLTASKEKIQCIVGNLKPGSVPFGQAQFPKPWEYADQEDTLKFLANLH